MSLIASFMNLAGPDLIVILLIILVLFGAKKLPELARGMGSAIKEFQKAKDEFSDELHSAGKTGCDQRPTGCPHARGDSSAHRKYANGFDDRRNPARRPGAHARR